MGFLQRLFKSSNKVIESDLVIDFCTKADLAYLRCFPTRSITPLKLLATREFQIKMERLIIAGRDRYFGSEKFRNTTWTVVEHRDDSNNWVLRKNVKYDVIDVGRGLKLPISEDYSELWHVRYINDEYKVADIEQLKMNYA